jgi:hypothetical protein
MQRRKLEMIMGCQSLNIVNKRCQFGENVTVVDREIFMNVRSAITVLSGLLLRYKKK